MNKKITMTLRHNPSTTISFDMGRHSRPSLHVFNLLGQEVATLINESLNAGAYTSQFNANELAGRVYFYRLEAMGILSGKSYRQTEKMLLVK